MIFQKFQKTFFNPMLIFLFYLSLMKRFQLFIGYV